MTSGLDRLGYLVWSPDRSAELASLRALRAARTPEFKRDSPAAWFGLRERPRSVGERSLARALYSGPEARSLSRRSMADPEKGARVSERNQAAEAFRLGCSVRPRGGVEVAERVWGFGRGLRNEVRNEVRKRVAEQVAE